MEGLNLEGLPEEDKVKMMNMIETLQMRDSLRMYNSLVEKCFNNCVEGFRRKTLDKTEETCVRRCAEKFLKHTARVSLRFAEISSGAPTPD
eukprot:jgi/Mesen1/6071/ME000031S05342